MHDATVFFPSTFLTFETVSGDLKRFLTMLKAGQANHFLFDLAHVVSCDSAGLAFLVEVVRLCKLKNKKLTIKHISDAMLDLATFCNIRYIFEELLDG